MVASLTQRVFLSGLVLSVCLGLGWSGRLSADAPPPPETTSAKADEASTVTPEQVRVPVSPPLAAEIKKMTCRTAPVTGSRLRTQQVCATPHSIEGAKNLLLERQRRSAIEASAELNRGN